jgi:hypothetical protein
LRDKQSDDRLAAPVFSETSTSCLVRAAFQSVSALSWPRQRSLNVPGKLGNVSKILIGSVGAGVFLVLPSLEKSIKSSFRRPSEAAWIKSVCARVGVYVAKYLAIANPAHEWSLEP